MPKQRILQAFIALPLIIMFSFLSGCGASAQATYQPPFTPVSFSIDTNGTISLQGDTSIATPVGTFSIGTNVFTGLGQGDDNLIVVIRHQENGSLVDTEYRIQTGQDEIKVVTNGNTVIDVTQHKVFIDASSGAIQNIEVTDNNPGSTVPLTCNHVNWTGNQSINNASSKLTPAITVFNNTLYVAFVDTNNNNRVAIVSSQDGINWTRPLYVGVTSDTPPALAVFNGTLYLAFASGAGFFSRSSLQLISSTDGRTWTSPQDIGQFTSQAPALAEWKGNLYLVFRSADNLLLISSRDGTNWTNTQPVSNTAGASSPTLTVMNSNLYLAFVGDSNSQLLIVSSIDGVTWSGSQEVGQFSSAAPTLATWNDSLCLTFTTNNSGHNLLTISSADSVTWTSNQGVGQSSWATPALVSWDDALYMVFIANNSSDGLLVVKGW